MTSFVLDPMCYPLLDLMWEDIAKFPTIMRKIKSETELIRYINNHTCLMNMMRRFIVLRNLLRPAKIRFATSFFTL